jgi:hypothetical protein
MDFKETMNDSVEWIQLAQVMDKYQPWEHEPALLGFQKWRGIF